MKHTSLSDEICAQNGRRASAEPQGADAYILIDGCRRVVKRAYNSAYRYTVFANIMHTPVVVSGLRGSKKRCKLFLFPYLSVAPKKRCVGSVSKVSSCYQTHIHNA